MTYPWPTLMPMGIVVISCVRPSVHGLGFVYCIQSAWKKWPTIWHADVSRWLTLSIHGCLWILLLVHLSVCSFTAFFLRLGLGQRRAVVIIGRWLLPSLVDTGDICCHYCQHILVSYGMKRKATNDNLLLHTQCRYFLPVTKSFVELHSFSFAERVLLCSAVPGSICEYEYQSICGWQADLIWSHESYQCSAPHAVHRWVWNGAWNLFLWAQSTVINTSSSRKYKHIFEPLILVAKLFKTKKHYTNRQFWHGKSCRKYVKKHDPVEQTGGCLSFETPWLSCDVTVVCVQRHVLLLRSDAVANLLTNGRAAFKWKLNYHWVTGLRQRQIAIIIQGPDLHFRFLRCCHLPGGSWFPGLHPAHVSSDLACPRGDLLCQCLQWLPHQPYGHRAPLRRHRAGYS